jgi:RNA polymerase sigma factor (sigma-70 family)
MVMAEPTADSHEPLPFDEVYRLYGADVYRFCLYQLRDPAAAEDISAEVFLSAFKAYDHSGVQPISVRSWLIKIARNEVVDHFRRNKRWRSVLSTLAGRGSEPGADPEAVASVNDELSKALTAIATLSARDRELIALRCRSLIRRDWQGDRYFASQRPYRDLQSAQPSAFPSGVQPQWMNSNSNSICDASPKAWSRPLWWAAGNASDLMRLNVDSIGSPYSLGNRSRWLLLSQAR